MNVRVMMDKVLPDCEVRHIEKAHRKRVCHYRKVLHDGTVIDGAIPIKKLKALYHMKRPK